MKIFEQNNVVWWEGPLAIDADGDHRAYHPDSKSGLDYLANAGGPGNWYGIVTDDKGIPVVQGPKDPCPGFYISPTSLQDKTKKRTDPYRYVNSSKVPYVAIPRNAVKERGLDLGDVGFCYCRKTGQASAVIIADIGPKGKWGEGSIALAEALGVNPSARKGGAASGIVVVLFKDSSQGWPRTNEAIAQQVQELLDQVGGFAQFLT